MKKHRITRMLSLLLVVAMLVSLAVPAAAAGNTGRITFTQVDNDAVSMNLLTKVPEQELNTPEYAETDVVRVSIILEERSTLKAGFTTQSIAENAAAMAYRTTLREHQDAVVAAIEKNIGKKLDVVWNLTLAANIISANVEYGQIKAIEAAPGVKNVVIETLYAPDVVEKHETADPNMATSGKQIGSASAWAAGYTGAGSRIAIIDTGADVDHKSFNADAFVYALTSQAQQRGVAAEEYLQTLNLLDAEQIAAAAEHLNVAIDADQAYVNTKIAFGYNYVDKDYDITHLNDSSGEHGSHVAGISAANAFVPDGAGSFVPALESVFMQGVAPDAQLMVMKVFGKNGGAYESDYMAAIEDAIILGADSVNLSLGSGNPSNSRCATPEYQAIMEEITKSGTVVSMSAGNAGTWVERAYNSGYLYADDVSMQTNGSPGSYTSAMTTASVDNDGVTGAYVAVNGKAFVYTETLYSNEPFTTLAGEQEYIFIDGYGEPEDWEAVGEALVGKIALCKRGFVPFAYKAEYAVEAGAIGTFIYNDTEGVLNMNLASYAMTAPVASLTKADAAAIKAASTPVTDENGNVLYYTGTMNVSAGMSAVQMNSPYYTMSAFSSWGVPGSLELKPEITAPGGAIYSVYGTTPNGGGTDQYVVMSGTSMAAPQTAGMAAVVAQFIREKGLEEQTGLSARHLAQSLLMSTAVPMVDGNSGVYYPVLQQGAGLANVAAAVSADSYILMAEDANAGAADGKVKVELGDDPQRTGAYSFSFTIHNMTDAEKAFDLSAAFFTQDVFEDYANDNYSEEEMATYMDRLAAWLAADVTWNADGLVLKPSGELDGMDFDGSGSVNTADGQLLLEHVVDPTVVLANADRADLDQDGDVDSHDAYLFFSRLSMGCVLVAPNGSVTVDVSVELTQAQKDALEAAYPNGAYVEGYVFAESLADAEGVEGTSHSIPVLGFYGNWTDASMYEVGSYQEYVTGEEFRAPYLENQNANAYLITYADEPGEYYYFGGNPVIPDDVYLPERNAINGVKGDRISSLQFTAIRNAAASRFTAVNLTTGEVYGESELGPVDCAFFYDSYGYWLNTQYTMNANVKPIDVPEGEVIELCLSLVPEYYVDGEGNVDWDALGEGAHFSVPMVVDNTAPVLKSVAVDFMSNTLKITASDNEYVAAVGLFNKAGTQVHAITGAKQDIEKNTEAEYVLDLKDVNGKRFLVQVFDYAMNVSTYLLELQIGGPVQLPEMIAFDRSEGYWTHFTKDSQYNYSTGMPVYEQTDLVFYAATIADHMILAATEDGDLYVMPEDDISDLTYVNNMGAVVTDMAYNKADGNVYGVADGELVIIDKRSGLLTSLGEIGVKTTTLACDAEGNFYCHLDGASAIYTFTADTLAEPEILVEEIYSEELYQALRCSDVQAMEINPNTGMLCWSSLFVWSASWYYSYYVEIDPTDGSYTVYNDLFDEFTALIIPEKSSSGDDDWTAPTDKVDGITISKTEITMLRNTEKDLNATVYPWTTSDRSVTWTSSDPAVAEVDENGLVRAHSAGTAVITATSNLDPTVSASCTVTVELLEVTFSGMLQDENGKAEFFTWNMATEDTWTAGKEIDTDMTAATLNPNDGTYYVMDSAKDIWAMHKVDQNGVTTVNSGANANKLPLWDMTYSTYFSEVRQQDMIAGVYDYYVFLPKDPMNLDMRVFDMYWYLDKLVGITSLGHETRYDDWYGVERETEHFMMVCTEGYVYDLWVYEDNGTMGSMIDYRASDLEFTFDGFENLYMYTSLIACDDGALYLSAFNGDTNELFRLTYNEAEGIYNAVRFADMGQDVWPAILTEAVSNAPAAPEADTIASFPASARRLDAQTMSIHDLLSADTNNAAEIINGEKTVTVTVAADAAVTNGLTTVTYDASKLELERADICGDYTARTEREGELTFGYVSLAGICEGSAVATLTFRVLEAVDSEIHVEHKQVNNQTGTSEDLSVHFEHPNTEIRGAVAATCTEDGYTGDVWCLDCGKKLIDGESIPALGHDWHGTGCSRCESKRENPFVDVPEDSFYTDPVLWAVEKGITVGMDATHFAPTLECNRAQAVTFLWRAAGSPEPVSGENPFEDVTEADFYYKAVLWAVEKGITNGVDATHFAPMQSCSRAQIVTFLWRAEGSPAADAQNPFTDLEEGAFYVQAVLWATEQGIARGLTETAFGPNTVCNRAQIVTFLYRAYA